MNTGMLWYDDDKKRPLVEKVQRAATYYANKFGQRPTECHVHPSLFPEPGVIAGCRMHANRTIIVNHFWLGVDTALTPPPAAGVASDEPAKAGPSLGVTAANGRRD